jgi:arylsulfatase A-like enzyme
MQRSTAHPTRRLPLYALFFGVLACSSPPEYERRDYFDLVAGFAAASAVQETDLIVFGSPEARQYLVGGFSVDEYDSNRKRPFVWSSQSGSRLRFWSQGRGPIHLVIEARPYRFEDEAPQAVRAVLNGKDVGTIEMRRGLRKYRLELAADDLRNGENFLDFAYERLSLKPQSPDPRTLAVAWYEIDFRGGGRENVASPRADAASERLFLPFGSEIRYLVQLERGSVLTARRLGFRGTGGRLEVEVETDEGGRVAVAPVESAAEALEIDLGLEAAVPARLVLRASGPRESADSGVFLEAPRLASDVPVAVARRSDAAGSNRPNVVIYMIDTLRADHLGCYGYPRDVSPHIDRFAARAVVFETSIGQSSWTRASVASLFTGLWPATHKTVGRQDRLSEAAVTMAEVLSEEGYTTAAMVTNPNVDARFGMAQGFDHYHHIRKDTSSVTVTDRVVEWLDSDAATEPFLLYVHTVDPHDPYVPSQESLARHAPASASFLEQTSGWIKNAGAVPDENPVEHFLALYDAEIADNDLSFGRLVQELDERGLFEDSLVVLLSDHGEEFLEHGAWTHGKNLYEPTLDFPLVIKFPRQKRGLRSRLPAQHVDILPTVLDVARAERDLRLDGRSLAAIVETPYVELADRGVYSHLHLDGPLHVALSLDGWKLIRRYAGGRIATGLVQRGAEDREQSHEHPIRAAVLDSLIEAKLATSDRGLQSEAITLDEDLERSLRALGYLN